MSTLVEELIDAAEQYEHEARRLRQEFAKRWPHGESSLGSATAPSCYSRTGSTRELRGCGSAGPA